MGEYFDPYLASSSGVTSLVSRLVFFTDQGLQDYIDEYGGFDFIRKKQQKSFYLGDVKVMIEPPPNYDFIPDSWLGMHNLMNHYDENDTENDHLCSLITNEDIDSIESIESAGFESTITICANSALRASKMSQDLFNQNKNDYLRSFIDSYSN